MKLTSAGQMVRELRIQGRLLGGPDYPQLQDTCHDRVQTSATSLGDAVVGNFANLVMRKPLAGAGPGLQDLSPTEVLQDFQQLRLLPRRGGQYLAEQIDLELPSDHRGAGDHVDGVGAQIIKPSTNQLVNRTGEWQPFGDIRRSS